MRYLLFVFVLLSFQSVRSEVSSKDSLLHALSVAVSPKEQVRIYRNLADIAYATPEEVPYLQQLYKTAQEQGMQEEMLDGLTDLAMALMDKNEMDSAEYYIGLVSQLTPREMQDRWSCYLSMFHFNALIFSAGGEKAMKAIDEKLAAYKSKNKKNKESLYKQIEDAYIIGDAYYYQDKFTEAIPYLKTAAELAAKLPLKEGYLYQFRTMRWLSRVYGPGGQNAKAIEILENVIALQKRYFDQCLKTTRPYYPMDQYYILNYTSLLTNITFLPEEKIKLYMSRIQELCRNTTSPANKYSCFLSLNNYYLYKQDLRTALSYNDSLIKYAAEIAPYNLSGLYALGSVLCEDIKNYKDALAYLKKSRELQDSLYVKDTQEKLSQLKVEYDVDRLNYEKTQLEVRNKRIMVISLTAVLALVVLLCGYLYASLKKERKMKAHLRMLKIRAEESEKMKTAFINSICHEIRTPLNAIVGFSGLIFDETLDEETRVTFPEEIRRNTSELTSLINSMLEVSNLDVSDEKLPCEPTDVTAICYHELDRLIERDIPNVECRAELPETPILISTHARYLALVIEHLLGNAGKFTERGSIVLQGRKEQDRFILSVTDTGCGIPPEMHQTVFDRFTKLDSFKQGSGLGLYLCQLIVRRLSGKIYIDPDYTDGTRMVVELPLD